MAVEAFPDEPDKSAEAEQQRRALRLFMTNPMVRGMPIPVVGLQEMFQGQVTYADTASRADVRELQEQAELFVATYSEPQLNVDDIYAYLDHQGDVERSQRITNRLTRWAVYLTGGYGSRILLGKLREAEGRQGE